MKPIPTDKLKSKPSALRNLLIRFVEFADAYPLRVLGLITVFGFLMSVIIIASSPPALESGSTDSWWVIAVNLINGRGYSLCIPRYFPFCGPTNQTTAAREPVPVLLFSVIALLSGESLWAATFIELAIFLAVLIAVFFLTREWANTRAALLAAFLWSFYPPAQSLIPQVSGDLLATLNVTVGLLFIMRARRTSRARDWLIGGVGLGLAIMSRSAVLAVAAIIIAGQVLDDLWLGRKNFTQVLKPFLILSGVVILIMAPWIVRNQISFGSPMIGSSLVGYNMFRQGHLLEEDDGLFRYVGGVEGVEAVQEFVLQQKNVLNGTENEAQMDLVYRTEAIKIILANPIKYMLISGYRFFSLWFNWGIMEGDGHRTSHLGYAIMVFQALFLILALIGIRGSLYRTWPLWAGVALISVAYMLVESQLRYLVSVMPLVLSLSAAGGQKLLQKYTLF
jgi:4-amino-4-deoxy-L-arabinose transferase-like glycosyltransferase